MIVHSFVVNRTTGGTSERAQADPRADQTRARDGSMSSGWHSRFVASFRRAPRRHRSRHPAMVERFFPFTTTSPPLNEEATGLTLLSGPPCWCGIPLPLSQFLSTLATVLIPPATACHPTGSCRWSSGKTSLLFQFAVNRASECGRGVLFICSRRRLENKPPFLSHGVDPSLDVLQRIQIKYVEDDEGIRKYFAACHLHDSFPAAVIVDDFADFFSDSCCQHRYGNARGRDLAMVRMLALCQDAIAHANAKLGSHGSCNLLLSDVQQGHTPRWLFIYKRWMTSIYTIKGDGLGSYMLKNNDNSESGIKKTRMAKYSIALQYLVLEEIINE